LITTDRRPGGAGPAAGWLVDGQDVAVIFPNDNLSCSDDQRRQPNCFPANQSRRRGGSDHEFVKRLNHLPNARSLFSRLNEEVNIHY